MLLAAIAATAFALTSVPAFADVVSARYATSADVPVRSAGFDATNKSVDLTLNFAPTDNQDLMLVRNTGRGLIQGQFNNLAHGQIVALQYQGVTYHFVANYYGGTGKDLVLMRVRLDNLSPAAVTKLDDPLILALKKSRAEAPFDRQTAFQPEDCEIDGRVMVDLKASASTGLLSQIAQAGGKVFNGFQIGTTLRAWVPLTQLEAIANLEGVQSMSAARPTMTHRLHTN
jgi:hypothetical protein